METTKNNPALFDFDSLDSRLWGVACGVGVDSVAMLVALYQLGKRPHAITFADVGAEKAGTYAFIPELQKWLASVDFPELTIVKRRPPKAPYKTIEENMVMNATLPGATFNMGSCTMAWKIEPQNAWYKLQPNFRAAMNRGEKIVKLIGFEAGETHRTNRADARAHSCGDDPVYDYAYPLMALGWDREKCKRVIAAAGMPVPPKSACVFCPNQKPEELSDLTEDERGRIVRVEITAEPYNRKVHGLWRRPRKSDGRPGSITRYLIENKIPFTHPGRLPLLQLNPNCKKAKVGSSFAGPHDQPALVDLIEDEAHAAIVKRI